MNNSVDLHNNQFTLPAPRTSLQNIGEKLEDKEDERTGRSFHAFGKDGFTFLDFLDVINPLQHIPLVGTMYRSMTGDDIDPGSRIAGSSLFGGPIGTVVALANVTIEQETGRDIGGHMLALITEENSSPKDKTNSNLASSAQSSGITNTSSPISTHAEVLEWAQKETARSAQAATEAQLKNSSSQGKKVTTNIEVLDWAREELALLRPNIETANTSSKVKAKDIKQTTINEREAALITSNSLGRDQAQLSGATSPLGGWFSETMLIALSRYDESAQLGKSTTEKRSVEAADTDY